MAAKSPRRLAFKLAAGAAGGGRAAAGARSIGLISTSGCAAAWASFEHRQPIPR